MDKKNSEQCNFIIVGRPNVGKSSIFNFLIKKYEAIVKNEEGTTIDWRSKIIGNIKLWDTPGVFQNTFFKFPVSPDKIFFVIENNVLNEDKKLYLKLQKQCNNVITVINKIDLGDNGENYSFFNNSIKISIKGRIGLNDLMLEFNKQKIENLTQKKIWGIIGKPNVGKSSLINILADKQLHKVEDFEGTTKEFLPVDLDDKIFLDTPGQRKKTLFPQYENVFGIILIMDIKQERQDLRLINLACERLKPCLIIINKIDLILKNTLIEIEEKINRIWDVPIIKISCLNDNHKIIREKILENLEILEKKYVKRIKTSELNKYLLEIRKIEVRLKFITQIKIAPPVFFIDFRLERHKEKMLIKKLSKQFDFCGIPLSLKYS